MASLFRSTAIPSSVLSNDPDTSVLKGKSILITGGAQGLGAELVKASAKAGAHVTIVDINSKHGTELSSSLESEGYKTTFVQADVTSWTDQVRAFKTALRFSSSGNAIDHVIINAGVMDTPFFTGADEPLSVSDPDPPAPDARPIDVNVKGAMYTLKLAQLYQMRPTKEPASDAVDKSILFILSPESYITLPGSVIYGGAKFGTRGLFRNAREALFCRGVRVNAVSPWLLETGMNAGGPFLEVLNNIGMEFISLKDHVKAAMHLLSRRDVAGRVVALTQPGATMTDVEDDEDAHGTRYLKLLQDSMDDAPGKIVQIYGMLGFQGQKQ